MSAFPFCRTTPRRLRDRRRSAVAPFVKGESFHSFRETWTEPSVDIGLGANNYPREISGAELT